MTKEYKLFYDLTEKEAHQQTLKALQEIASLVGVKAGDSIFDAVNKIRELV